jgi:hypothetical protein
MVVMDQTENKNSGEMASYDEHLDDHRVFNEVDGSLLSNEWTEVEMNETEAMIHFLNSIKRQLREISPNERISSLERMEEKDNAPFSIASYVNNNVSINSDRLVDYSNYDRKGDSCFSESDKSSDQIDSDKCNSSKYSSSQSNKSETSFPGLGDIEEGNEVTEALIDPNLSEKVQNACRKLRQYQRKIVHILEVTPEVSIKARKRCFY